MNILYVTQFYPPENIAGAFRAADHSRIWQENGSKITIFTGYPNYPKGKIFDGYHPELLSEELVKGVRVLRSKLIAKPNTSLLKRVINGSSFLFFGVLNSFLNANKIGTNFDVVLASSGTIFAGSLGYVFARRYKIPFVIEFRDLTYVQMMATGSSVASKKVRLIKSLELFLANKATAVITLTNGFKKELITQGLTEKRIEVIPNGAELKPCRCLSQTNQITLGYFGTLGISQDIERTLELAKHITSVADDVRYRIIGDGAKKMSIKALIKEEYSEIATYFDGMPQAELETYYEDTDFTFVSLVKNPAFSDTIPSKIFQSFARGVPVIFSGPAGEASEIVEVSGAGIVLVGTSSDDDRKLKTFFSNSNWKDERNEMSIKARAFIEKNYSREKLAEKMLSFLERNIGK